MADALQHNEGNSAGRVRGIAGEERARVRAGAIIFRFSNSLERTARPLQEQPKTSATVYTV
jgi:hypothetical protein